MVIRANIREAEQRLEELIELAKQGQHVVVGRYGRAEVRFEPIEETEESGRRNLPGTIVAGGNR